jgi:mono/diheme cytochrome c family protein
MGAPFDPGRDRLALGLAGLVLLGVSLAAVLREANPGWEHEQANVRGIVRMRVGEEAARSLPTGIRQVWIERLDRVDRCVTCHVSIEGGPALARAPHPARSHPRPELLAAHPVEKFGCTLCHGGQGWATSKDAAHGRVPHWDDPLLDSATAKRYGLTAAELLEVRCNACHRDQRGVAGMPLLEEAKASFDKRKCIRCHSVGGVGGHVGPDLDAEGDKHPSLYSFPSTWKKPRSALAWHIEHLRSPEAMVPGSQMPTFTLDERQRAALALLVLSWRTLDLPAEWLPGR